jgi:hypothetical protein
MPQATISSSTITVTGATPPSNIDTTKDYGCFIYLQPNSPTPVCALTYVDASLLDSAKQWMDLQLANGQPKYPHLGILVLANAQAVVQTVQAAMAQAITAI